MRGPTFKPRFLSEHREYHWRSDDIASRCRAPGYGFLAENAEFAKACPDNGLVFIGLSPEAIELTGNKARARESMKEAGVDVIPGVSSGSIDEAVALREAEKPGFPLLRKASLGGGGKVMRLVNNRQELISALPVLKAEAKRAFASDDVYLEKFVPRVKHVEIQVVGDMHGNVIHLLERDCSLQRRNQKGAEETPALAVDDSQWERMGQAAIRGARLIGYYGAGTVEFLLDNSG